MTHDEQAGRKRAFEAEKVVIFPQGIPGFEKYTTFRVYHKEENDFSAFWLESCEEPGITFTIVDPVQYGLGYTLELTEEEREVLQAEGAEELGIFMMLSKKEEGGNALNANIAGPLIINPRTRRGLQKLIRRPGVTTMITQAG